MDPVRLSVEEFAAVLDTGEVYERIVESGAWVVLVDGGSGQETFDQRSMQRLRTLAAVVVGVVPEPGALRPEWADVVVGPGSGTLQATLATVDASPRASTTLAVLLRTSDDRSIPEGLVAESVTYGLLQNGPEFLEWRHRQPVRERPDVEGPQVLVARRDHELSITLNRPHVLNAFSAGMRDELCAAVHVAAVDPTITSVIVRGSGSSFSSGGDLDEFGSRPDPVTGHLVRLQRNVGRALAEVASKTTVHIHGSTVGSGIELAAFAHRVVARTSTRISLPEVRLGLIPGSGGTVSLPMRIGRHATMLLALGVPSIDAETALDWGLVDELEQ
jgi:hypothetical protein